MCESKIKLAMRIQSKTRIAYEKIKESLYVTLENKSSLKSHGYICSNSQQ